MQIEYYDYDIVNQLLDEKKYLKLPPTLFNSLEKYQKMVVESKCQYRECYRFNISKY